MTFAKRLQKVESGEWQDVGGLGGGEIYFNLGEDVLGCVPRRSTVFHELYHMMDAHDNVSRHMRLAPVALLFCCWLLIAICICPPAEY